MVRTQVARALGLQQRYDEARALLDEVAAAGPGAEARVRERLERGRVLRSGGDPDRAGPLFAEAAARAGRHLPGLRIDALHMSALVAGSPTEQAALTEAALDEARAGHDPAARRWAPSLLNNLGMCTPRRRRPRRALAAFEQALAVRRERRRAPARPRSRPGWSAGRCRLLGRDGEALGSRPN